MADEQGGAEVRISVGLDEEASYKLFDKGIQDLVDRINKNPPIIQVDLEIEKKSEQLLNAKISKAVKKASAGVSLGDPGTKISNNLQGMTQAANEAERVAKNAADAKGAVIGLKTTLESLSGQNIKEALAGINIDSESADKIAEEFHRMKLQATSFTAKWEEAADEEQRLLNLTVRGADALGNSVQYLVTYDKLTGQINTKVGNATANIEYYDKHSKSHVNTLKQAESVLGRIQNMTKKWSASEFGTTSGQYKKMVEAGDTLEEYIEAFKSGGTTISAFKSQVASADEAAIAYSNLAKEAGEATGHWASRVGKLSEKFTQWFGITQIIMAVVRVLRQAVDAVIQVDTAMTELRKVTDETSETYDNFLRSAIDRAKELGTTVSDIVTATADFARLGYNIVDASTLADAAVIYKNVGDGINDISDASESVIATMQAFGIEASQAMSIVDKFNEVGNRFAISSKGVGDALLRSAAAMKAANNTLDETIALATAANVVVQDPEKVGTSLKTLSMYLRAAKTEAEDAGESTEGMAKSVSELREELLSLTGGKVDIQADKDTFKSTYQILKELSSVWGELTDITQANILEMVGGKRNANIVSAMIENFSVAENVLETSIDSAGSAMEENEKFLDSVEGHITQFKAAVQTLGEDLVGSETVKGAVDLGTSIVNILDNAAALIDKIGGLKSLLPAVIGLLGLFNGAFIEDRIKKYTKEHNNLFTVLVKLPSAFNKAKAEGKGFNDVLQSMGMSKTGLVLGGISAAVSAIIVAVQAYHQRLRTIADDSAISAQKTRENAEALADIKKQMDEGTLSSEDLTKAFTDQLTAMGYTEAQIQGLIDKYHGLRGAIDGVTASTLKQSALEARDAIDDEKRALNSFYGDIDTFQREYLENPVLSGLFLDTPPLVSEDWEESVKPTEELTASFIEFGKAARDFYENGVDALDPFLEKTYALRDELNEFRAAENADIANEKWWDTYARFFNEVEERFGALWERIEEGNSTTVDFVMTIQEVQDAISGLPDDALEVFNEQIGEVVNYTQKLGDAGDSAINLANNLNKIFSSDAAQNLREMAQDVADGTVGIKNYSEALAGYFGDYTGGTALWDATLAYFTQLPEKLKSVKDATESVSQSTEDWLSKYDNIPEIVEEIDNWADVAAQASAEMAENGEISNDTVKALSELVVEGEDWLQYLTLENGELKLNVELLKERAMQDANAQIESLETELHLLQDQNDELVAKIALQKQLAESETITSARAAYDELMTNFPKNPTPSDIARRAALKAVINQPDLMISGYQTKLDDVLAKIEEYQKRLAVLRNAGRNFDSKVSEAVEKVNADKNKEEEETTKTFNWIESILDRIQRKINEFSRIVSSKFKSLSARSEAAKQEIKAVTKEIELQENAYRKYIELCDSISLSDDIKQTVQDGAIDISEYDEETAELISQYQEWYEAALDTKSAVDELHESLASLYDDEFTRIQTDFENRISLLEYLSKMYNTGISQLEAEGYMASKEFYSALTVSTEHNIELLEEELDELEAAMQAALDSGEIEKYSEAWYGYAVSINGVKEAIADANLSLAEFSKTMREIDWGYFDYMQERISGITDESEFLRNLLNEDDVFKDGKLTSDGLAVLGLRAMDYNVYMAQADKYAQEILDIEQQLASDPYNKDLLDRREELLKLQRESILSAEDEKDAILDLVHNAFEEQLDSLKELIEAYKDALDAAKDLYDYRNKISDETSEISSLQKQISAYQNDSSEETRATVQRLNDQLEKAQKQLQETEYDKYISDQKKLLDHLYSEYELLLNSRMDNTDALLADIIAMVNQNANAINDTLHMTADSVGYTLSDSLQTVWGNSFNSLQSVVAMYGDGFLSQLTTTNQALNNIAGLVSSMQSYNNNWANNWVGGVNNSYIPDISGWTPGGNYGGNDWDYEYVPDDDWETEIVPDTPAPSPTPAKQITVGGMINAGSAPIYDYAGDTSGERQYYGSDPIYRVLEERNGYLLTRWYKLSSGYTGWFKKSDVKAYKNGGLVDQTGLVWLDGTKQNPEIVLDAEDAKRFKSLVESMDKLSAHGINLASGSKASKFIDGFVGGRNMEIMPVRNPDTPVTQEVAISIPIDHVMDYNDFVNQLARDKNGKRIIQALALDDIAGKNSLRVNKYRS